MNWRIKKEKYYLTWRAKILILLAFSFIIFLLFKNAYSFLAPQKPIQTNILVVEGWLNDYALQESLDIFNNEEYDFILITGGPLNTGYILTNYRSTAEVAKATLLMLGADSLKTIAINRELVWRDRTYTSALALKKYLNEEMSQVDSFNLVSLGAHSRRSWLLFQHAMPHHEIGIITIEERLYEPKEWWKTSKGFRSVITEGLGYFYILFFF